VKLGLPVTTWQVSPPDVPSWQVALVVVFTGVGVVVVGVLVVGGTTTGEVGGVVAGVVAGVVGGVFGGTTGLHPGCWCQWHVGVVGGGVGGVVHARAAPEGTSASAVAAAKDSTTRRVFGQGRGWFEVTVMGAAPSRGVGMLGDIGRCSFPQDAPPAVVALTIHDPDTTARITHGARISSNFPATPTVQLLIVTP
jgi:hypothetical protein